MAAQEPAQARRVCVEGGEREREKRQGLCPGIDRMRGEQGVKSEKELVRAEEFKYVRLYCTDHVRPHDHTVDEFLARVRRFHGSAEVFYHFHWCVIAHVFLLVH